MTTPIIEVVAGAAFIQHAQMKTYLLQRHPSRVPEWSEKWCYPGGKVEPGESHTEALVREWLEEVKAVIRVGELLHCTLRRVEHPDKGPVRYRVWTYHVTIVGREPSVLHEGGQDEIWVPIQGEPLIPLDVIPGTWEAVAAYRALR